MYFLNVRVNVLDSVKSTAVFALELVQFEHDFVNSLQLPLLFSQLHDEILCTFIICVFFFLF